MLKGMDEKIISILHSHIVLSVPYIFFSSFFLSALFMAFDENRDSHIDFKEIACGISACCRGPQLERQKCK